MANELIDSRGRKRSQERGHCFEFDLERFMTAWDDMVTSEATWAEMF